MIQLGFSYLYILKTTSCMKVEWIQDAVNRRNFHSLIILSLGGLTVCLTLSAQVYQGQSTQYLHCVDPAYRSTNTLGLPSHTPCSAFDIPFSSLDFALLSSLSLPLCPHIQLIDHFGNIIT